MSAIRSAVDEMAAVPDDELATDELQEQLADLEAALKIARTLLTKRMLMLLERLSASGLADEPSIKGGEK